MSLLASISNPISLLFCQMNVEKKGRRGVVMVMCWDYGKILMEETVKITKARGVGLGVESILSFT